MLHFTFHFFFFSFYKGCLNDKVQNDTVGINEDFIQSVHHRPEHNNPID